MKNSIYFLFTLVFLFVSCSQEEEMVDTTLTLTSEADSALKAKTGKVNVCHYDADTDTWKTLNINGNALEAHLNHGDYEGECSLYTYVPDDEFERKLIEMNYDEGPLDDYVLTKNIEYILDLDVTGYTSEIKIKDLTGIEDFKSLEFLNCGGNQITSLDLSNNLNLETIYCFNNLLTYLNVTGCVNLKELRCNINYLTDIDVSNNKDLEFLNCWANNLEGLNLKGLFNLYHLGCSNNKLVKLDLTDNKLLTLLSCYSNQLIELDISQNLALEYLSYSSNQLACVQKGDNPLINLNYLHTGGVPLEINCGY